MAGPYTSPSTLINQITFIDKHTSQGFHSLGPTVIRYTRCASRENGVSFEAKMVCCFKQKLCVV